MDPLHWNATANTPEAHCDPQKGQVRLAGQSYPENAVAFYQPLLQWTQDFLQLEGHTQQSLVVDIDISYFNSSTSRALQLLFETLDAAAANGHDVVINWHHHEDNEMSEEYGEDFQEDMTEVTFNILAYDDSR